jgi:putative endonuclease
LLDSGACVYKIAMAFWVYILRCSDGRYYTGHTENLQRRIAEYQTGGFCDFTSRRRPITLMWSENFQTRIEALETERRIKPWSRAKKEALIKGDWATVSYFRKPPRERPSTSLGTNGDILRADPPSISLQANAS